MRDYGFREDEVGRPIKATRLLMLQLAVAAMRQRVNAKIVDAYHIDSYYSHFKPEGLAANGNVITRFQKRMHEAKCDVRDMESAALFMLGKLRGINVASILVNVRKHNVSHEMLGDGRHAAIEAQYRAAKIALEVVARAEAGIQVHVSRRDNV